MRRDRGWLIAEFVVVAAAIVAVVLSFVLSQKQSPFGDYPTQRVLTPLPISLDRAPVLIKIAAEKCHTKRVLVSGTLQWEWVDLKGNRSIVTQPSGARTFPKGCTRNTFVNVVPSDVIELAREGRLSGWHITGASSAEGFVRLWSSDEIRFTTKEAP